MPSISDLKNDGNQPFIPTIEQEAPTNEPFVPTINGGDAQQPPIKRKKGSIMSMTTNGPKVREKADFSDMPQTNAPEVEKKDPLDVLKPGGVFDQYLAERIEQAHEYDKKMAAAQEEAEIESEINGEEFDDDLDSDIDEEVEISKENNSDEVYTNRTIDFDDDFSEEDEEDMNDESNDILDTDDQLDNDEELTNEVTEYYDEDDNSDDIERSLLTNDIDDDESLEEDEDDTVEVADESSNSDDEKMTLIKAMITEKLKPVSKRIDISSFTIASKPMTSTVDIMPKEVPVAKWALPNSGVVISMKEIKGSNLEKIRSALENNDPRTALQIIYQSIVSEKPATLDAWLKTISFDDYEHLFMAVYIASFADSNFIPIDCPNKECNEKTFITDNIPIMDMVEFKDKDAEKKFKSLLKSDAFESKGLRASEIVPISDRFAFGFVLPSIYSVMIETGYLDQDFINKYTTTVSLLPYIDNIYFIDQTNKTLNPIGFKEYTNNTAKTLKSKVVKYDKVISTLNADEIAAIRAYIKELADDTQGVTYCIPEVTCPYCGTVRPKVSNQSPTSLVFLRNRLGLLVTT